MSLRSRVAHAYRAFARDAGPPVSFFSTGDNAGTFFNPTDDSGIQGDRLIMGDRGITNAATRAIADRVSTLTLEVRTTRSDGAGTMIEEVLDDHVLKTQLLDRPHPDMTTSQLLQLMAKHLVIHGESYLYKVGSPIGVPVELHVVQPERTTPVMREGNVIAGYRHTTQSGQRLFFPRDVIVRAYFPDPANPWAAKGYIEPSGPTNDASHFATHQLRSFYLNDATPKIALKALPGSVDFTPAERERFQAEWQRLYNSLAGQSQGGPAFTPTNYDLVQLAYQTGSELVPLLRHWEESLLMGHGVPRSILGQVVAGDRSSAEVQEWTFDKHAVAPIAQRIADAFTAQLAPDFDANLSVGFAPFVADDKDFELRREAQDLEMKVRSINEVREERKIEPASWGELPVGSLGDRPYDGERVEFGSDNPFALGGGDDDPDEDPDDDDGRRAFRGIRAGLTERRAAFARVLSSEEQWAPPVRREIRAVLRRQRDSILARLPEVTTRGTPVRDGHMLHGRVEIDVDRLFNPEEWVPEFQRNMDPHLERAFYQAGRLQLEALGSTQFFLTDEMRKFLRDQGLDLARRANETTKRRLAESLGQGVIEGESIGQLANRVRRVFRNRTRKEANTIARTEVGRAAIMGTIAGGEQLDEVVGWQWHTSLDGAVRDSHRIDGQIRRLDGVFVLRDGETAQGPLVGARGGALSARNAINCRCFVTPVRRIPR